MLESNGPERKPRVVMRAYPVACERIPELAWDLLTVAAPVGAMGYRPARIQFQDAR